MAAPVRDHCRRRHAPRRARLAPVRRRGAAGAPHRSRGRGRLASYLLDTYSGRKLGLPSTHHAARDGIGVTVATTNLYLAPGTASPRTSCGASADGLYVTELIGFGVNGVTGDYSRGAVGLWIENGELAYPVEEITVAGNLLEMFQAVDGVGNDLVFRDRTSAPTLLIGRMVVAGS